MFKSQPWFCQSLPFGMLRIGLKFYLENQIVEVVPYAFCISQGRRRLKFVINLLNSSQKYENYFELRCKNDEETVAASPISFVQILSTIMMLRSIVVCAVSSPKYYLSIMILRVIPAQSVTLLDLVLTLANILLFGFLSGQ